MTLFMQLLAIAICTGSGDICRQTSIKSKSLGFITVSLTPEEINGNGLDCSLQLTHLPQHALIEISANSYLTPYPCRCANEHGMKDICNFIQISGLAEVRNYCLTDSIIPYLDTNDKNNINFTLHYQNLTAGLTFNITYKG